MQEQIFVQQEDGTIKVVEQGYELKLGEKILTNEEVTSQQDIIGEDVASILEAIEQGQDPTQLDDVAPAAGEPAAGGATGSSIDSSAAIGRDGAEVIASAGFNTNFNLTGNDGVNPLDGTTDNNIILPTISINTFQTSDDILNQAESLAVTISGTTTNVEQGQVVTIELADSSDPSKTAQITVEVDLDGNWVIPTEDLLDLSDAGFDFIDGTIIINASVTDLAGNSASAQDTTLLDTQATISIDPLQTGDDIINAIESDAVVISGTTSHVNDGQTITIVISDSLDPSKTASVQTQVASSDGINGTWSLTGAQLLDLSDAGFDLTDGVLTINASVTDLAGNSASAQDTTFLDTVVNVAISVDDITADNLIVAVEARLENMDVTGQVTGEYRAGDIVTLTINNNQYTGSVNALGEYTINVVTADLVADQTIDAQVVAHDSVNNTGIASTIHSHLVDIDPPTPPAIEIIAGEDALVEAGELSQDLSTHLTFASDVAIGDYLQVDLNNDGNIDFTTNITQDNLDNGITLSIPTQMVATDGDIRVSATIMDNVGNISPQAVAVIASLSEGDLSNGNYSVTSIGELVLDAQDMSLDPATVKFSSAAFTTLESSLNQLTSAGEAISFTYNDNSIVGTLSNGDEVLTISLTSTIAANGEDIDIDVIIEQTLPLDNLDQVLANIEHSNDRISFDIPLEVTNGEGEIQTNLGSATILLRDGLNPSVETHLQTNISLTDTTIAANIMHGNMVFDLGSDQVQTVRFSSEQDPNLENITSNGHALNMQVAADGKTFSLVDGITHLVVLEVALNDDGSFTTILHASLDQTNANIIEELNLRVDVTDFDNDTVQGNLLVHEIIDGVDPQVRTQGESINYQEQDLDATSTVSHTMETSFVAGSDRIDPNSVRLSAALIAELGELTSSGNNLVWSVSFVNGVRTYVGKVAGNAVLEIKLEPSQVDLDSNDVLAKDVQVEITVTQTAHLDHDGDLHTGLITLNNGDINIQTQIQAQDTDGDWVTSLNEITIIDGVSLAITQIEQAQVDEEGIDSYQDVSGSEASTGVEQDSGDIDVNLGSDPLAAFEVDVATFNLNSDLYSSINGEKVVLEVDNNGGYIAKAGNLVVFNLTFDVANSNYQFDLISGVKHEFGNEQNITTQDIPVRAVDTDGTVSEYVNLVVTITDDVPDLGNDARTITEGRLNVVTNQVLGELETGADDAQIDGVSVDGNAFSATSFGFTSEIFDNDTGEKLGVVDVYRTGQIRFTPDDGNFDHHDLSKLSKVIDYTVIDNDGDTSAAQYTINIKDRLPRALRITNIVAQEEDGRGVDIEPSDNVGLNRDPIELDISLNLGDQDRGEHVTKFVLNVGSQQANSGKFYLDGDEVTVSSGGVLVLDSATDLASNVSYSLLGVETIAHIDNLVFIPNEDFSTANNGFRVYARAEVSDGSDNLIRRLYTNFKLEIEAIADTPEWIDAEDHYITFEDAGEFTDFDLQAQLNDTDGSETLRYLITFAEGEADAVIAADGIVEISPGVYAISAANIDSLTITPNEHFSGDIKLNIIAESRESNNAVGGKETAQAAPIEIVLNVLPSPDATALDTNNIRANEDTLIDLSNLISVNQTQDPDSETVMIRISQVPNGAQLLLAGVALTIDAQGRYIVTEEQLADLQLKPVPDSNVDFALKVEAYVQDKADITDENQNTTTVIVETPEELVLTSYINVDMRGIAEDQPRFTVLNTGNNVWQIEAPQPGETSATLYTNIEENGQAQLNFNILSSELGLTNSPDGSEKLSFIITNLPDDVKLYDSQGRLVALTYVGEDSEGNASYEVNLATIHDIRIEPAPGRLEDINLEYVIVTTENDGHSTQVNGTLFINIEPQIDTNNYVRAIAGVEDEIIDVAWMPNISDADEEVVGLTVSIPDGFELYLSGDLISVTNNEYTFNDSQLTALKDGSLTLQVKAPEDSDLDKTIQTEVTLREIDFAEIGEQTPSQVEKTITGTIALNIQSQVEADTDLVIIYKGDVLEPGDVIGNGHSPIIHLNDAITISETDLSSDEVIINAVIQFIPEAGQTLADHIFIKGATYTGNNTWLLPADELDHVKIHLKGQYEGSNEIQARIGVQVQDQSDEVLAQDHDLSEIVIKEHTYTFALKRGDIGGGSGHPRVADIDFNNQPITGSEDNAIDFGAQLSARVSLDTTANLHHNDVVTVLIPKGSLPEGVSFENANVNYNYITQEYAFSATSDNQGNLDFGNIDLVLPEDFSGNFDLSGVHIVNMDFNSGAIIDVTPPDFNLNIVPIVDVPGSNQPLDSDVQPDISAQVTAGGEEGEDIHLNLQNAISLADRDGSENLESITLTIDPEKGSFLTTAGLTNSITITAMAELADIIIRPNQTHSGQISLETTMTISDGALTDTYATNIAVNVVPLDSGVSISAPTNIMAGEDNDISLTNISGQLLDTDGSEAIIGVKLSGIPNDFIVQGVGVSNNGNGVWSINTASAGDNFSLDNISIIPPENYSGSFDIGVTYFTKEAALNRPYTNPEVIVTINITPQADSISTNLGVLPDSYIAVEGDEIIIDLQAKTSDDQDSSLNNPAHIDSGENDAETLLVTISNVPESASIRLPDGVSGEVTGPDENGNWYVMTTGGSLDAIIFATGDSNNTNWSGQLDINIRAVDNGVVASDAQSVDTSINLDITPVNDLPLIDLATDIQTGNEDQAIILPQVSVDDIDLNNLNSDVLDAAQQLEITLTAEHGVINVVDNTDISVLNNNASQVVITGTKDALNQVLAEHVTYQAHLNYNGSDTVKMQVSDLGNIGSGNVLQTAPVILNLNILAMPDPVTLNLDIPQTPSIYAASGQDIPILGFDLSGIAANSDDLYLEIHGLPQGVNLVDSNGEAIGMMEYNDSWLIHQNDIANLHIAGLEQNANIWVQGHEMVNGEISDSERFDINIEIKPTMSTEPTNITGADSDDYILGSAGEDALYGADGDDVLDAGAGDDNLNAGLGEDYLIGGLGDDTFTWTRDEADVETDTVADFELGNDQLDFTDFFESTTIDGEDDLTALLNSHIEASTVDGHIELEVSTQDSAFTQHVVLDNIEIEDLGLTETASSVEIVNQLFENQAFKVDPEW